MIWNGWKQIRWSSGGTSWWEIGGKGIRWCIMIKAWWKTNQVIGGKRILRWGVWSSGGTSWVDPKGTRFPSPVPSLDRGLWLSDKTIAIRRTPLTLTTFVMPNQDPETVKQYKDEWYVKNREAILKRKQQHPAAKKKQQQPGPKLPPSPSRQWEEKNLTDRRAIDTETAIVKRWERSIALITTATGRGLCDNNMNVEPTPRTLFVNYVLWPKCVPSSWGLSTTYQQAKKLEQHRQYRVRTKTAVDGMVDMKAINRQWYREKIAQLKAKGEYETFKKHKATVGKRRYHNM